MTRRGTSKSTKIDIRSLLAQGFTQETARQLYAQGEEVAIFVMMQLVALALKTTEINGTHPSTPSASVPPFQKEPRTRRGKKPGAKPGHPGSRRPPPDKVTHHTEHRASCCPDCGGKLRKRAETRKRYTEDIPQDITPEVTEHTIHRDYCTHCRKTVEPTVPDAMPNATIGHRTVVLTAFLHYFVGATLSQIVEIFNTQFYFKLTPGGLSHLWRNLALALMFWYDQIRTEAKQSSVLHADETGWRVNGKTYWLWCFTNQHVTYYVIDKSRASPVVKRFFRKAFNGILVTDFYGAYNAVVCAEKQRCLVHLLGDLKKVGKYKDTSGDWFEFSKRLKRLLRDAMRLRGRKDRCEPEKYTSLCLCVERRLNRLLRYTWENCEAKRLVKRLKRHRSELFVFLYHDGVPADNNHAERTIRNGVVMRKNSYGNRSLDGSHTQAVLMSIFATLKQRGHHGTKVIVDALREYITTKKMPELPRGVNQTAE